MIQVIWQAAKKPYGRLLVFGFRHLPVTRIRGDTLPQVTSNVSSMADTDWDLLSSYAGLLSLATFSIYAGAFGSLPVCPL